MRVRRRMQALFGCLVLLVGGIGVAFAPPATAVCAPSVVSVDNSGWSRSATIKNTCGATKDIQVILNNYRDSGCVSVNAGQQATFSWKSPGQFQYARFC